MSILQDFEQLPLMESFYTLQGEGFHQGRAAYFIRLAGCDVGCVWCDVKESWEAEKHPLVAVSDIVNKAAQYPVSIAVITGGEPLMHQLDKLTSLLKLKGFQIHLETSGSSRLSGTWDWICLSPKKFKAPLPEVIQAAHELKVVIYNKSDFVWAESFVSALSPNCKLYLQPEWSKAETVMPMIIDYIKENPQWELSLQIHKYIQVP